MEIKQKYKKGQIIFIKLKLEDSGKVQKRLFVVGENDGLFQVVEGYNITSIGNYGLRKKQFVTHVPIVPNELNKLHNPSVIKMNRKYTVPEDRVEQEIGQLSNEEMQILDIYENIYNQQGIIKSNTIDNLEKKLARQKQLFDAVKSNDGEKIERLIADGANPMESPYSGVTALHVASLYNATESAHALISAGAYIDARDSDGQTPLFYAVKRNNTDMTKLLISNGADPNVRAVSSSIYDYADEDMKRLLDSFAVNDKKISKGRSNREAR